MMAVCDFDMRFTSIVAGWPGSAHDTRIFKYTLTKYADRFPHPAEGKYYLVDSGYPNATGYLAPYKGTKYHLPEFRQSRKPSGKKEVFNHAHSSLRNVIERTFGVLKMKWHLLQHVTSYPTVKQTRIIVACMALHNWIRESNLHDKEFYLCDQDENYMPGNIQSKQSTPLHGLHVGAEHANMNDVHEDITNALMEQEGGEEDDEDDE